MICCPRRGRQAPDHDCQPDEDPVHCRFCRKDFPYRELAGDQWLDTPPPGLRIRRDGWTERYRRQPGPVCRGRRLTAELIGAAVGWRRSAGGCRSTAGTTIPALTDTVRCLLSVGWRWQPCGYTTGARSVSVTAG